MMPIAEAELFHADLRHDLAREIANLVKEHDQPRRLLDTLRMMLADQGNVLDRVRRQRANENLVDVAVCALTGQAFDPELELACKSATFLAEVLADACDQLSSDEGLDYLQ